MCLQLPQNVEIDYNIITGYQLPFARNRIVQHALESESDYVFFIDADMIFPSDSLIRLFKHNLDIVNALAFRRTSPHYPTIFEWNENEKCYETMMYTKGLLEVDASGMACILIKTEVFRKMKQPWYYYRDNQFSSDITFCENARKEGFKIMIDTDLKIGHLGDEKVIDETYYFQHLCPEAKEQWNSGMRDYIKKQKADFKENNPK